MVTRNRQLAASLIFSLIVAGLLLVATLKPRYNFDVIFYVAVTQHGTFEQIHDHTYSLIKANVPPATWQDLSNGTPLNSELYANPYEFGQQFPFYSVRPLYVLGIKAISLFGVNPVLASVLVSVISGAAIAAIIWFWVGRYADGWQLLLLSSAIVLTPPFLSIIRLSTPDALASALMLGAYCLGIETTQAVTPLVLALLAVWARTDSLIWAAGLFLLIYLSGRLSLAEGAILSALAVASHVAINYYGGAYSWGTLFYYTFITPLSAPGNVVIHISPQEYARQVWSVAEHLDSGVFLLFMFLAVLAYFRAAWRVPIVVLSAAIAVHFVLFPILSVRYLAAPYLVFAIGAAAASVTGNHGPTGHERSFRSQL